MEVMLPDARTQRPVAVWVICLFHFLAFPFFLLSLGMIYSGTIPLDAATEKYFLSFTFFDHACTVLIASAGLAGAIALFLLRKAAYPILLGYPIINALFAVWQRFTKNLPVPTRELLLGLGIGLCVALYARKLAKIGVLR